MQHLTITGSISEEDFEVLRTSFDKLTTLDLTNVTITTSLRTNLGAILPAKALAGNKTLEIISLPRTLTSIGQEAFSGCKNLKEMSVHTTTPPEMGADVFKDVPNVFRMSESAHCNSAGISECVFLPFR